MLVAVAACGGDGGAAPRGTEPTPPATEPAPPSTAPSTAPSTTPSAIASTSPPAGGPGQPQGFELVAAEVTAPGGDVCALCLWLADTPDRRGRGLMGVTDLGPADGMVFRFETPSTSSFYMLDTPTPLSIAFFAGDGSFVSATDMAPCLEGPAAECPRYPAAGPFTEAIEVPAGELDDLGIEPGARLVVLAEPCPPS